MPWFLLHCLTSINSIPLALPMRIRIPRPLFLLLPLLLAFKLPSHRSVIFSVDRELFGLCQLVFRFRSVRKTGVSDPQG